MTIYKLNISFLALIGCFYLFSSCSDKNFLERENEEEEVSYKTGNDLSASHTVTWDRPWEEEAYQMLGYGYDATGRYAHPTSVRAKIIDLQQMRRSDVTLNRGTSNESTPILTGSLEQFVKELGANANMVQEDLLKYKNLFRGSFVDAFGADTTTYPDLAYAYAYVAHQVVMHSTYFNPLAFKYNRVEEIDSYLFPQFKQDIADKSAEDIILKYGTHVLQQAVLGRRVDYLYRHSPYADSHDAQYWFTRRIRENFNLSPHVMIWPNNADAAAPDKENLYIEVVDNAMSKRNAWMFDVTNYSGSRVMYTGWDGEYSPADATLIDISFHNNLPGIMPIYEFVNDPVKKQAIKAAMERYLSE